MWRPARQRDRAAGFRAGSPGDDTAKLRSHRVTGSRIKKAETEGQVPVQVITAKGHRATGLGSDRRRDPAPVGERLAQHQSSTPAGNFGFAADGSGVGSGSTTISLRNLNAKRTPDPGGRHALGERRSSASGASAAVDLNTIPASAVERIEILTDGASSLYGSDAIAGVVNVITKKKGDGLGVGLYYGNLPVGDGETYSGHVSMGASTDRMEVFLDVSHFNQHAISSAGGTSPFLPDPGYNAASAPTRPYTRNDLLPG